MEMLKSKKSKTLGRIIEYYSVDFVELCKNGSKKEINKYLLRVEEDTLKREMEKWEKASQESGSDSPLGDFQIEHAKFMARTARQHVEDTIQDIRNSDDLLPDEKILFLHEEGKQVKEEILQFRKNNKDILSNSASSLEEGNYVKDIVRFNELCEAAQRFIRSEKKAKRFSKQNPFFPFIFDSLDSDDREIKNMFRKKTYRESYKNVVSKFFPSEYESPLTDLLNSRVTLAEDLYEAGARMIVPGSVYSGKK